MDCQAAPRDTIPIKMFAERVNSIAELQELASAPKGVACFIFLRGNVRSSKHIWFRRNRFRVLAEIDWTVESAHVSDVGKLGSGNIAWAIENGAFYRYLA
jgi:hypothetical protein